MLGRAVQVRARPARHAAPNERIWPRATVRRVSPLSRRFPSRSCRPPPARGPFLRLCDKSEPHSLHRRKLRRNHQPLVVGMAHDQSADQAGAHTPTGLPDVIELAFLVLKLHVESAAEILTQIVARPCLQ